MAERPYDSALLDGRLQRLDALEFFAVHQIGHCCQLTLTNTLSLFLARAVSRLISLRMS